jgi:SAM-dependent methyltransferase
VMSHFAGALPNDAPVQPAVTSIVAAMERRPGRSSLPHPIDRITERILTVELEDIVACPRCRSRLALADRRWVCTNPACAFARDGFPTAAAQPVLVDFDNSVFRRADYQDCSNAPVAATGSEAAGGAGLGDRLRLFVFGDNRVARAKSTKMLNLLKQRASRPRLLVIGGWNPGEGTETFLNDPSIDVVATGAAPTRITSLLADPHSLPFHDEAFDGVWIQATLEHVLEPHRVIDETHRVLKPSGVIYAENLFIMGVHEGPRDFVRYTQSGHRWLFRHFDPIEIAPLGGAGWALLWSIRYFWRAFGLPDKVVTLLTAPFFWLRYCDRLMRRRDSADAAIGFYSGPAGMGERCDSSSSGFKPGH